jgi:hypothetical protein
MTGETLLSGYILRVAVKRNRWHLSLHNLKTGEVKTFDSFEALSEHLALVSSRLPPPPQRC